MDRKYESVMMEDEFYDYGTGTADLDTGDIFSTKKSEMSYYDNFLLSDKSRDYMRKNKNQVGEIVMMTPIEYFNEMPNIFDGVSPSNQLYQTSKHTETLDTLKRVLQIHHKKFPIPFLNYSSYSGKSQEGRHRMYVAGELFGWDHKFPVLIINDAIDPELYTKWQRSGQFWDTNTVDEVDWSKVDSDPDEDPEYSSSEDDLEIDSDSDSFSDNDELISIDDTDVSSED